MKLLILILCIAIFALSWQLDRTTHQRNEADRMSSDCIALIEAWQRIAVRNEAGADYWFRAHMETIRLQSNNPNEQP